LLGDRFDLQKFAIEQGVRLLVITNGYLLSPDLCTLAEKNGVSVIVSPYDSTTTSMMLLYSAPVQAAADAIESVTLDMPIKRIKNKITQSKSRALPVVEANSRKLWGIVTESDLMKEPNVEVILVDHNELSQSIEGVENYKVREVVDHHRLGSFKSNEPITFINRVVGSTSSIIASLYRENRVPIPKEIASLLLCGVISDTLGFKSVTTTDFDRQIAYDLATIAHLDCEAVINDLAQAADQIGKYTPHDLVNMDKKGYERDKLKYFVSQIETNDVAPFLKNHQNYLDELSKIVEEDKAFFAACLITDLGKLSSYLFIEGNADFIRALNSYPEQESNVFFMKNVLSRKKQLMPLFSEIFTGLEG
jgi:manganese-dependent inorganic pyrophosphatase